MLDHGHVTSHILPKIEYLNVITNSYLCVSFLHFKGRPKLPDIDLAFALGAASLRSTRNFQEMKKIINEIIDEYGTYKFRYAVLTFGDKSIVKLKFDTKYPTDTELKRAIEFISKSGGGVDIERALKESRNLMNTARPQARKVLVLVVDKSSDNTLEELKAAGKSLEEDGIRVIPVAFGNAGDPNELGNVTPIKDDVIPTNDGDETKRTAKKIMDRVLNGKEWH